MSEQLVWRSAVEQAAMVAGRQISARELVEAQLERIAAVNPRINAIVTLVPDRALAEAGELDRRLAAGEQPGPLHGLPVAVKDLVDTAGIRTTQGSPLFADHVPVQDDLLVTRLRGAGAVIVGKTNTPEFGAGSHTFNPVFGLTRNPWDASRTAGGSSGGAAAAVAAGMLPVADGSDMGGSLRNPAAFCNVCGLRPSPGRWPAWPRLDPFDALSVQGPIARSVADLRLLLDAVSAPDGRSPLRPPPAAASGGLRVGFSPDLGGLPIDADVAAVIATAPDMLVAAGCSVEPVEVDLAGADEAFEVLRAVSFAAELAQVVADHPDRVKRTVIENVQRGLALTGGEVASALAARGRVFARWCELMERYDAIAAPVTQVAPFPVEVEWPLEVGGRRMGSYIEWMRACTRISVTAHPALSLPCGFTAAGLPVGLQLVGRLGGEHALLDLAAAVEAVSPAAGRRPPEPPP